MEIIFFKKFPPVSFNILKETMLVQKQLIHQKKALDLSFNFAPWNWAWHYQKCATASHRKKHRFAWGKKSYSRTGERGSLMVMPYPLLGCQIKAEIKDFLLKYCLFQYKYWFFPNFELKDFPEYTFTPYNSYRSWYRLLFCYKFGNFSSTKVDSTCNSFWVG